MCELVRSLPKMVKLAEGGFGTIYDVGNNRVMKVTRDKVDKDILMLASSSGIGPRIYGYEVCSDGKTYYIQQKLVNSFKPEYLSQLPELVTRAFENGLLHNDLHTENMMADASGRLYLIDFDLSELISKVGVSNSAFHKNTHYLDMETDTEHPIAFTEDQMNRIRRIRDNPATKQAELKSKNDLQRVRDEARRQMEERQREAIRRIKNT